MGRLKNAFRYFLNQTAERAARTLEQIGSRLNPHPDHKRRRPQRLGVGERVFSNTLTGGTLFGWPGGWSQDRVEQVLHFKEWVWAAIDTRATFISTHAPCAGIVTENAEMRRKGFRRRTKAHSAIQAHEEVDYLDKDHALSRLLSEPNQWDDWGQLSYELEMFQCLTGNGYLWVVPNGWGKPCELWVIPSHWVWPRVEKGKWIVHYEIRPFAGPGQFYLPPEEVIHLPCKNPIHKLDGNAPLNAIATWVDVQESVNLARFWSFKNGCFPWGSIELDPKYADLDDSDMERAAQKFYSRYQGEYRTGLPLIMSPGTTYKPLMMSPTEMCYTESSEQVRDWILSAYKTPKEVVGIQDAGSEIAIYGPLHQFCTFGINPRLHGRDSYLTRHLARRFGADIRIWTPDTTPENPEELRANLQAAAAMGGVTPNDARTMLLGLEPFEHGGDDPFVPNGLLPMPLGTGEDLSDLAALMPPDPGKLRPDKEEGDDEGRLPSVSELQRKPGKALPLDVLLDRGRNGFVKHKDALDHLVGEKP